MHAIRLRGPWIIELHPSGAGSPTVLERSAPVSWDELIPAGFGGSIRCRRSFGCPTGLTQGDTVDLAWGDWPWPVQPSLNGELLSFGPKNAANVTGSLQRRNELVLSFAWPPLNLATSITSELLGDVRLEISPPERV